MKIIKQLSIIILASMLVAITSCTMEKRVYMSGYNIEALNGKYKSNKQIPSDEKTSKIQVAEQSVSKSNTFANTSAIADKGLTASADEQQIILPKKEKINLLETHKVSIVTEETEPKPTFKAGFKKGFKILMPKDEPSSFYAGISLIYGIAAIIFSFVSGISLYAFLMTLLFGVGAIISGAIVKSNPDKYKGRGVAKAGLICGIIALGLALLFLIAA